MKSIEEKLLGQLYCFCEGGSDTGGGSAGDFDDSYNQAMGYTDSSGQATGTGGDSDPQRTESGAVARTSNYQSRIEEEAIKAAGGGDYTDVFAGDTAAFNDMQRVLSGDFLGYGGGELGPSTGDTGSRFDTTPAVRGAPRDVGQGPRFSQGPSIAGAMTREQMLGASRPSAPEEEKGLGLGEVDIFDTAYTGGATPAQQVQAAAGVQQARSVGSPNDIRNRDRALNEDAIDGGDVGDFYEVLAPEVQKKADEEAKAIREAVEKGEALPGEINPLQPFGIVKGLYRNLFERDKEFARQANLPGARLQVNDQGQITGVYNPQQNAVYTPESVGLFDLKAQKAAAGDLYDMQRQQQEEERARSGGDSGQPAVVAPVAPATCPDGYKYNAETNSCEYVGQSLVGGVASTSAPITQTTQYTGIGGLQPFVLQPSYTAPTTFRPLYNVG